MNDRRPDLPQIVFAILILCGLLAAVLWILAPFAAALIWATTIVVATWPVLLKLQKLFGGRRGPATAVLTLALLLLVVVPFLAGLRTVLESRSAIVLKVDQLRTAEIPPLPPGSRRFPSSVSTPTPRGRATRARPCATSRRRLRPTRVGLWTGLSALSGASARSSSTSS